MYIWTTGDAKNSIYSIDSKFFYEIWNQTEFKILIFLNKDFSNLSI